MDPFGYDLMTLPQHMAASVKSIELMAIPFFLLAAALMNAMNITPDQKSVSFLIFTFISSRLLRVWLAC